MYAGKHPCSVGLVKMVETPAGRKASMLEGMSVVHVREPTLGSPHGEPPMSPAMSPSTKRQRVSDGVQACCQPTPVMPVPGQTMASP